MDIQSAGKSLGAFVRNADLTTLCDEAFSNIESAFNEYSVLIFESAHLTREQHIAFSRRFGLLERTLSKRTERQEISLLSNVKPDGSLASPNDNLGLFLKGNRSWHSDSSFKPVGAKASMLRAIETPSEGGDTEWLDMRKAWDTLSIELKNQVEALTAVHSYEYSQGLVGGIALLRNHERDELPPVRHPMVKVHVATGRKSLYLGRHIESIDGLSQSESQALLDQLTEHAEANSDIFRHRWRAGDIALWDNRCVMHRGHAWPFDQRRVMERTTVAGEGQNPWALA